MQQILDPCCGGKMFYFEKDSNLVLFGNKQGKQMKTHWLVFVKSSSYLER